MYLAYLLDIFNQMEWRHFISTIHSYSISFSALLKMWQSAFHRFHAPINGIWCLNIKAWQGSCVCLFLHFNKTFHISHPNQVRVVTGWCSSLYDTLSRQWQQKHQQIWKIKSFLQQGNSRPQIHFLTKMSGSFTYPWIQTMNQRLHWAK